MMIPLGICSFMVLLITLERVFVLRRGRLVSEKYLEEWKRCFSVEIGDNGKPGERNASILTQILIPVVDYFPLSRGRFEERLADLARQQKHRLERGLVFLDTIAGIAPLFGLLGTALGMVEVFSRLSVMGEAKMSALSSGISQALFTTVAGLFIGIPSLVAFNLFSRHIDNLMITIEEQLNSLIDEFYDLIISA
ncbi:MAG: MotA/TolQ/ExbB proton channel family protein [Proteobacteria bacterium]|nr:MotA/TolQ/ExbB proton channel family protein [Pseudomonadota bacterium]